MSAFSSLSFSALSFSTGVATVPSPVVGVDVPDHVAAALGRLIEQFKNQPNIKALVSALAGPSQPLEAAYWQLLTQRTIYTGIGNVLDAIGNLVGQPRNGLSDSDYRRYLLARISTNDSGGLVNELLTIVKLVLNDPTATIVLKPEGTATVVIRIGVIAVPVSVGTILSSLLDAAAAGGIRLLTEMSALAPGATFRFDTGPGFDVGGFAYAL